MKKNQNKIILDFETTGVYPDIHQPIQIGLIVCNNNWDILFEYEQYIKPYDIHKRNDWEEYEKGAFNVHNIPFSTIKEKGKFQYQIVNEVEMICNKFKIGDWKPIMVNNNVVFDYSFLKIMLDKHNRDIRDLFYHSYWDTNLLLREFYPDCFINDNIKHTALEDCKQIRESILMVKKIIETGL